MSTWELRQYIESHIPAWLPFVLIGLIFIAFGIERLIIMNKEANEDKK